jgi:penicillin-binding protein A
VVDDGLGGGIGDGLLRFGALLAAAAILALGIIQRQGNTDARWLLALAASAPFFVILLWPRLPADLPTFNRTVVRLGTLLGVAFLLTSIHLVRLQVIRGEELATTTRTTASGDIVANPRLLLQEETRQRGRIVDRVGNVMAGVEPMPDGTFMRTYPAKDSSYLTGYYSPALYGTTGLEAQFDDYLTGNAGDNPFVTLQRELLHRPLVGNDLVLTLDPTLQHAAEQGLAGRPGAVVALDPRTGAVLAMASDPHIDPQQLVLDPRKDTQQEVARARAYWAAVTGPDARDPLLQRVTQGLYVPGSIFKTITAASALDSGVTSVDRVYSDPGEIVIDGHQIVELNRPQPVKDSYTLTEGFLYSLNVVFAQVAVNDLGTVRMDEYAKRFGIGQSIPFGTILPGNKPDLPVVPSRLSDDPNYLSSKTALADTGFGQGELLMTPLQMALAAATMANGGKMPQPYLVGEIRSPDGKTIMRAKPKTWLTPVSSQAADKVKQLMLESVDRGGSVDAKIDGLVIGGKTGTAEIGDGDSHAWFICFAGRPNKPPELAIAVIVERGGFGSRAALPIARSMIEAYFAQH